MSTHPPPFALWGPGHQAVLAAAAAGVVALGLARRRLRRLDDRWLRRAAALVLTANETAGWATAAASGVLRVPLQLCDLAVMLTIWALWSLRPEVSVLAYFWVMAGSLQAILTPDLQWTFPDYWWVQFFISHCGALLSVVYLAVTGRVRPCHRSVWQIFGLTNLYAVLIGIINWTCGTNYGYLVRKPSQPSLLDLFGPWPWYILAMEGAALASLYLYYAPFALPRREPASRS